MDELQRMNREIKMMSLVFMLIAAVVCAFIWHDAIVEISGGIVIGTCCGLIGFAMINNMSKGIEEGNAKAKAYLSYLLRFTMYGIIFALCISRGINVFALLAGMLCHKLSIIVYSVRYREEMD